MENYFKRGQVLEVRWQSGSASAHWFAQIVLASGQFLAVRFVDDLIGSSLEAEAQLSVGARHDVWVDGLGGDVRALGWCEANGATLKPPSSTKT